MKVKHQAIATVKKNGLKGEKNLKKGD